jgi:HSP20 family protein
MANIRRWSPFRDMMAMQNAMDRVFNEMQGRWEDSESGWGYNLALDIDENSDTYLVTTDLPGVNPEDIDVRFENGVLTINAEVNERAEDDGSKSLVRERRWGRFSRSIRLPQNINVEDVDASYENGVLTLSLPKSEEAKPRQIEVKSVKQIEG